MLDWRFVIVRWARVAVCGHIGRRGRFEEYVVLAVCATNIITDNVASTCGALASSVGLTAE